ncbi:hypothetical protein [Parabacteroides sp. AM08-6]|uniref:hypothetical protein n=1 Tax=Parabacteroides sp. AM08-6 TaxID=2292053 RepID=UPI000EFDFBD2|nr:hypothetical protein [Parabacteroides sp. AM08-6]RHJ82377.1 hypothetical protein DW103_10310 [Parabacteroides sp. AM08-6]
MKKVIGLLLVVLISTVTVFAQNGKSGEKREDPSKRMEKMITELKLDKKQAADFRKISKKYQEKMVEARKEAGDDRQKMREKMITMRDERNAEIKKILTEEQYKQYLEKQQPPQGQRRGRDRK